MVIGGGGMLGLCIANNMRLRVKQLKELERIILFLEGEIRVRHSILSEAFRFASKKCGQPFNEWLIYLSDSLSDINCDSDFYTIWTSSLAILRDKSRLNKTDLSIVENIGQTLGYLDIRAMEQGLSLERENIKDVAKTSLCELPNRVKISIILGILGGVFIIIVLL